MLKKVVTLRNVGLLRNGSPAAAAFDQVTLIYGENGRGKSTLATVLRAAATHDVAAISLARTIDTDDEPTVELVFLDDTGSGSQVNLRGGAWSGNKPPVYVFDPAFVEDNVFSGQEVRAEQRQSLLQFALGEDAVELEKELVLLTTTISEATRRETEASRRIAAYAKQLPPKDFIKLVDVPDAESQIEHLHSRIEAAKNSAVLSQRPLPEHLPQVDLDIAAFFSILHGTFSGIREDAKEAVQRHFQHHGNPAGLEGWITQGMAYAKEDSCPFCGQDLRASDILSAYDAYFNKSYNEFMSKVGVLAKGVEARLSDSKLDVIEQRISANDARINAWKDQLPIDPPAFDLELARSSMAALRSLAAELAERKQQTPLELVGSDGDIAAATNLLQQIRNQIATYNEAITATSGQVRQFITLLSGESPAALTEAIRRLEAIIARRLPEANQAVADYQAAEAEKKRLNDKKAETRRALDELLPRTLGLYQGRINTLLRRFGATFEIVQLESSYTGGTLRSDYALQLRGRSVRLGRRGDTAPSFGSLLSEGDKRTLALAFFLARLQALGGDLSHTTVVFDDPMCSLDRKRREMTIASLQELVEKGVQLVVLSHDPDFLNDLRKRLMANPTRVTPTVHEIKRVQDGYSAFAPCDLEEVCESDYYRSHRLVRDYVEGGRGDRRAIAKELRPLMEGFLKQRFPPPLLPATANLGEIIRLISASEDPPLAHAKQYVAKLDALNRFDTRFHHNDGTDLGTPDDGELTRFAEMTLEVIYGDYTLV